MLTFRSPLATQSQWKGWWGVCKRIYSWFNSPSLHLSLSHKRHLGSCLPNTAPSPWTFYNSHNCRCKLRFYFMGAEVSLPDVTTGDPQIQPSLWGSVSAQRDSVWVTAGTCRFPHQPCLLLRPMSPAGICSSHSSCSPLCLSLSGLDSLTNDPSCHQSQYWTHWDNTGSSLPCEDRHLWSICETILAKEDRQLYFVPNIAWQVWTHPRITLLSSWLKGQESTFDRENRLWLSDRKWKQQHPEHPPPTSPFVNQMCQI